MNITIKYDNRDELEFLQKKRIQEKLEGAVNKLGLVGNVTVTVEQSDLFGKVSGLEKKKPATSTKTVKKK